MQIADGLWCLRSDRWQTNTAVAVRDGHALVCDPSWTAADIVLVAAAVAEQGVSNTSIVVTHADEDHVCGLGAFPAAEVITGVATARVIASGAAAERLAAASGEWGIEWRGAPFVTRSVEPGPVLAGPFALRAIEAAGHAADGTGWLLVDARTLLPGDYLSAVSPPLVLGSVAGFRTALERFAAVLSSGDVTRVIPGHGPVLDVEEALAIAAADSAYLAVLTEAALSAAGSGRAPGEALVDVWSAAVPPRPAIADLAVYDPRTANARAAVAEAFDTIGEEP